MYAVSVSRSFVAQHSLTVPDAGPDGTVHSHHYTVEATVRGPELDAYGYLVDVGALTDALDTVVETVRDRTLNELPALEGQNPSPERFARLLGTRLCEELTPEPATELEIRLQEDDAVTVAHERAL
ncbi:6-pyruvoyl trahydropterin synthase family protein [Halopiger goleimassiliensis]|uniref:6-pyruvoyl trahydropterin synthase family protein n=1 Tax=Halopiger goleimassiliensis TaxID=1293048 RepID=UPI000677AEC6|nr:6-carboxytetrahydropterin synthase [Halopiger goleimassiliensis]